MLRLRAIDQKVQNVSNEAQHAMYNLEFQKYKA